MTEEKFSSLQLDVQKLTRENLNLKGKVVTLEGENKTIKEENQRLKEISNTDYQEKIRSLNSEIERLQVMDKDGLNRMTMLVVYSRNGEHDVQDRG